MLRVLFISLFILIAQVADAVTCPSPPTGSCLAWSSDCEIASGTDDNYTRTDYQAVDARGVDWLGPMSGAQYEVELNNTVGPVCFYGGKNRSGLNSITTTYDTWHTIDGFQSDGPYQYWEEVHAEKQGDGIAQVNVSGDCSVGPQLQVRGSFLEKIYDDAIEKDRMGPAIIEYNYIKTYKAAFAARPQQACEDTIDSSSSIWSIKNNLVEMQRSSLIGDSALGCDSIGGNGHGYPFKWPTVDQGAIGPKQALVNNVFLMEDVYHECFGGQIYPLADKLVTTGVNSCKGNVILFNGYEIDDHPNDWEELVENHGAGPDGNSTDYARSDEAQATYNGASTPCYEVVVVENTSCGDTTTPGTAESLACLKDLDLSELAHLCPGGTACSWNDLVSQWQAAHTSDNE